MNTMPGQHLCSRYYRFLMLLGCFLFLHSYVPVHAADDANQGYPTGTHAFRRMLHEFQLETIPRDDAPLSHPQQKILIVFGDGGHLLRDSGYDFAAIVDFASQGGAVLLASDHPLEKELGEAFGWNVRGRFLRVDDKSGYRGLAEFPFVRPHPNKDNPIFEGLSRIATNRPSYLRRDNLDPVHELFLLAELPRACRIDGDEMPMREPGRSWRFAVGGKHGKGQVLILADHSIFINSMMQQTDNDNAQFAYNCIDWLRGPEKQRDQVLFIEDGTIQRSFNVPLRKVPPIDAGTVANLVAHEMDKDQRLDRMVYGLDRMVQRMWISDERLRIGLDTCMYSGTMVAFLFGLSALLRMGWRSSTSASKPGTLAQSRLPKNLLAARQQALANSKSFWEPAHELARQFFESSEYGGRGVGPPRIVSSSGPVPKVAASGGIYQRWKLSRRVQRLWNLAYGPAAERITAKHFSKLPVEIERLKALLAAGQLRIEFK